MGVPASEFGYTSTTTRRGDHEVHKGHVMALDKINTVSFIRKFCFGIIITGVISPKTA
jgi:hypothetical protein